MVTRKDQIFGRSIVDFKDLKYRFVNIVLRHYVDSSLNTKGRYILLFISMWDTWEESRQGKVYSAYALTPGALW